VQGPPHYWQSIYRLIRVSAYAPSAVKSRAGSEVCQERTSSTGQPEGVRHRVEVLVDGTRAERVGGGPRGAQLQLSLEVPGQQALRHGRRLRGPYGADQVGVREGTGVVEVEGVPAVMPDVLPGPVRRLSQPAGREPDRGQRQLSAAQLHVVMPDRLRIEVVRQRGDQLPHVGGLGLRVDLGGRTEVGAGLCPIGLGLRGQRERGGDPAGQVGAELRPRGSCTVKRPSGGIA
jgi:hypothetical protein